MKNLIFLSIDDLNDWTNGLGGYSGAVHTPNLDRLMAAGTTFSNAFAQVAICNPSRTSVLTGRTPQETGVFQNTPGWEHAVAPEDTLFGALKGAGYKSVGFGKLFHTGPSPEANRAMFDRYEFIAQPPLQGSVGRFPAGPQLGTEKLGDEIRTDRAIEAILGHDPESEGPLVVGLGLEKPHTDWIVPQRFFDLYPLSEIRIDAFAGDTSDLSRFIREETTRYRAWEHDDVRSETIWKQLIQSYLASISFMDEQVGRVLDALEDSAIAGETSIVLWSDHGYHLGDKDTWHKFTLWDNAARSPLVIVDPDIGQPGTVVDDVVELIDIFPTVLDLLGLDEAGLSLSGKSLAPYLEGGAPEGAPAAFTWMFGNVSIRTNDFRYSLYEDGSEELYNIRQDPELLRNLANVPALAETKGALRAALDAEYNLFGYGDRVRRIDGTGGDDVFANADGGQIFAGGAGDDIYFVHRDTEIVEQAGGGRDLIVVEARIYKLPRHVEDLDQIGQASEAIGNRLSNVISTGARVIEGRRGHDTIYGTVEGQRADLGTGRDAAFMRGGNDTVFSGSGRDSVYAGAGDDLALGQTGDDYLFGDGGADTLWGGSGRDCIEGSDGDDRLIGQGGRDTIVGGFGADLLSGGGGRDLLIGGPQDDTMRGGGGADLFLIAANGSTDVILDYEHGEDRFIVHGGVRSFDALVFTQIGPDVRVDFGGGFVIVRNGEVSEFSADDFLFQ